MFHYISKGKYMKLKKKQSKFCEEILPSFPLLKTYSKSLQVNASQALVL